MSNPLELIGQINEILNMGRRFMGDPTVAKFMDKAKDMPPPTVLLGAFLRIGRDAIVKEVRSRPVPPKYVERIVGMGYTEEHARGFYDAAWEDGTYD